MGNIERQGVSNSVLVFVGAGIGALNILVLYPLILPKEYFGLTNVLVQVTFIATQFGLLGSHTAMRKFWGAFVSNVALFRFLLGKILIASSVVLLLLWYFQPAIIEEYKNKAVLFTDNYEHIYVLFLFGVVFELFFSLAQANLKTVIPVFVREVLLRIYQSGILLLLYFGIIRLSNFISMFVSGYVLVGILMMVVALTQLPFQGPLLGRDGLLFIEKKKVLQYSSINFLTGFSSSVVGRLDVLMIGALLASTTMNNYSLQLVAVYTVAIYISNLVELPSRGLFTITSPVIARLWNDGSLKEIGEIYTKASINLTIFSVFIFGVLWANIDDIIYLIPQYAEAKTVILVLGLGKVYNMILGVNNNIIINSRYYRVGMYTMILLIALTFVFNYFFIPLYGINGAAIGTLMSVFIYNSVSLVFLYYKYKMHPFSWNTLKIIGLGLVMCFVVRLIDVHPGMVNIVLRIIVITGTYFFVIYRLSLSLEVNRVVKRFVKYLKL